MSKNKISVFVGNWALYNAGYLAGGWIDLPASQQDLDEFLRKEVKVDPSDPLGPEYGIFDVDYDGYLKALGFKVAGGSTLESLNLLAHLCDEAEDFELAAVRALMDQQGSRCNALHYCNALMQADEIPWYAYDGDLGNVEGLEAKLGYSLANAYGLTAELERLGVADYFDYGEYGEAMSQDFYPDSQGYLDAVASWPDLGRYSYEDVFREVFGYESAQAA